MLFGIPGIKLSHRKNTAKTAPVKMTDIKTVTLPMSMHIGKPATPVVKVGDKVFVGTLIGENSGGISSDIYSSVSGTVKKIGSVLSYSGTKGLAVVIESDGQMTEDPNIAAPSVTNKEELIEAIRKSGIVGLGGASFPTYVKFSVPEGKEIEELIINCAECEPYITSDTRTMLDRADDMLIAIKAMLEHMGVKRITVGIEQNKSEAIEKMKELASVDERISVKVLSSKYPQGAEKVLIYNTTKKVVPAGKLPIDVGCVVVNCTTLASIGEYLRCGMPLVRKCITVDGGAVKSPKNVIVPIGTPIIDVIEFTGGFSEEPKKVIFGGPMMGVSVPDINMPVTKGTNAILAFSEREAKPKRETACIHCGACAKNCPYGLNPAAYLKSYKKNDIEELSRLRVDICMECGCCSYVCPAAQPLTETNKLAKAAVREAKERNEGKEQRSK